MSKLFIMAGTKGGIGKSLAASLLADVAFDCKYRPVLFDCDDENRSLSNFYDEQNPDYIIKNVDMRQQGRLEFPLDTVVNGIVKIQKNKNRYPGENAFILDMKAGTSSGTMVWLKSFPFLLLKEIGIETCIVGVVTSELDSSKTLIPWLLAYLKTEMQSLVRMFIVKNEVAGQDFSYFDEKIKTIFAVAGVQCDISTLHDWGTKYQLLLPANKCSYGMIATGRTKEIEALGFMDEYRIKHYYSEVSAEFRKLFAGDGKTSPAKDKKVENGG